ncbi:uncharacterized protein HMPREF1541_10204 [Cyphellophora europaea CBS 101466]|uniref:Uncharacterized protein n=1 Tax=Cyphellophora europaea (strain CBS 101466) TaxID=1220924 RepID=W2S9F1_CYPE1|nr:uncharacterized protein HMPREF1541_10204 [Cyphellophora europaea CBS 101466]ETN44534.1 hypothetical protein HMPREF1541_10204 [Cyphellophora europaea CBS 101466]
MAHHQRTNPDLPVWPTVSDTKQFKEAEAENYLCCLDEDPYAVSLDTDLGENAEDVDQHLAFSLRKRPSIPNFDDHDRLLDLVSLHERPHAQQGTHTTAGSSPRMNFSKAVPPTGYVEPSVQPQRKVVLELKLGEYRLNLLSKPTFAGGPRVDAYTVVLLVALLILFLGVVLGGAAIFF